MLWLYLIVSLLVFERSNSDASNFTVIKQTENNFQSLKDTPLFPCDNSSLEAPFGSFQTLDFYNETTAAALYRIVNAVFNSFYFSTYGLTDCTDITVQFSNLTQACTQVDVNPRAIRLNYGVEFTALFQCLAENVDLRTTFLTPIRSVAHYQLTNGSFRSRFNGLIVEDIWFYENPYVSAVTAPTPASAPEPLTEAVAPSPEEAVAPEETVAPEPMPHYIINSAAGTTVDLLTPAGRGSNATQLGLFSPAVQSTSSTVASAPELAPQPDRKITLCSRTLTRKGASSLTRGGKWSNNRFNQSYQKLSDKKKPFDVAILCKTLICLDFDVPELAHGYEEKYQELQVCPKESTRKGFHYILSRTTRCDSLGLFDGARQFVDAAKTILELDIKTICRTGTAGVLVIAPSTNKTWIQDRAIGDVDIPDISDRLLDDLMAIKKDGKVSRGAPTSFITPPATPASVSSTFVAWLNLLSKERWDDYNNWIGLGFAIYNFGSEHSVDMKWCWLKFSAFSARYDEAEALRKWQTFQNSTTSKPITLKTIKRWARDDSKEEAVLLATKEIPRIALDNWQNGDQGLSHISHHLLKDVLKLSAGRGKKDFFLFDETQCLWGLAVDSKVKLVISSSLEDCLKTIRNKLSFETQLISDLAQKEVLENQMTALSQVIRYVQSHKGLNNILSLGHALFIDHSFEQRLDSIKHLVGVQNGVVDLRTGLLRDRTPDDMIFNLLDTSYSQDADTSWVQNMFSSCMADDEELTRFLQKLMGYALTGETQEEIMVFFTGSGRNGKGSLMQTLAALLGTFYVEMNPAIICERQTCNIDAERGKLQGSRVAVFNELEPGERLKSAEAQLLSGGDLIPAKPMYKDPVSIVPRHQCFIVTNHLPRLAEVIPAIIERFIVINWPVSFCDLAPGEEATPFRRQRDNDLKALLQNDRPAFLKWIVEGAVSWYATKDLKRNAPESVKEFTRQYLEEQDVLQRFLSHRCRRGSDLKVSSVELLQAYNAFAPDHRLNSKDFAAKMQAKGFTKRQAKPTPDSDRVQCFEGIALVM